MLQEMGESPTDRQTNRSKEDAPKKCVDVWYAEGCEGGLREFLRPHVLLVLVGRAHRLDDFLAPRLVHAAVLGNDLAQQCVDLARHVGGVTADVEVGLLLEQPVDFLAVLLELVLHVDLLGAIAREGNVHLEVVAESLFVFLEKLLAGVQ